MMTSPHTLGVGLAKTSPTLNSSVLTKTPVTTPSSTPSPAGTSSGESDPELRYISKYLVQVISNATPKSSTSAAKRVSGARVLTSAKYAAILEEREEKKKKEIEEKNKRKAEREQKKKEKEEAAKKKAEDRAKKAEQAAKKRENRAKKRTVPMSDTGTQAKKRKTTSESTAAGTSTTTVPRSSTSSTDPTISSRNSSRLSAAAAAAAAAHSGTSENDLDATINSDICCVCYRTFEDDQREGSGLEWVQCVCGRWLHEECICEIDIDDQGRELLCMSFLCCLMLLMCTT